ncbi:alpha/beta fold hydrolase [Micromonospora sp. WMMD1102]|uniref:alpha/beta fold hydrolase n=1 Tax=Micromonospora sp. WMMD1102 TaxID=3016105 RepID=UPI002414DD7A|nr:alpha/beta fold hydrolase [Micromonospora sp. WMMD1102]MDG4785984.1 alpha/beta fold hydrolase [Micromonospora sp. WMMD1102]
MSPGSTPILLLHGSWHAAWCWNEVIAHLVPYDRQTLAVDMVGHGLRARRPECLTMRPFDPARLATEVSPVADVDLDRAAELLVRQIERLGRGSRVTVLAHSMGGVVLTRAAQQAPELVAHAVYLAAVMPGSGEAADRYFALPENADALVLPALRGDPTVTGALRLDLASNDPAYRQQLRAAFYGDVGPIVADAALGLLSPDAPVSMMRGITRLTRDGWGSVPRTYVVCTRDMAIRPALQRLFVAEADAAFPENPTSVATLDSSHAPFLSMPGEIAKILGELD